MEKPITVKAIKGEDGPEAEERLYQGLLLLLRIAAGEDAASEDVQETPHGSSPAA
jgi:hypothetical protein